MSRCRLFCPTLAKGPVALSKEETHHAITVRRVEQGDEVVLFDGEGREAAAIVAGATRGKLHLEVGRIARRPFELRHRITLAVAMPKARRAAYLVEKCTELGVAAVWPILAKRAVVRPKNVSVRKWSRRAVEAAKQSCRAWVPTIAAVQTLDESCRRLAEFDAAGVAVPDDAAEPFISFIARLEESSVVLVWIGPEGGWSAAERDRLIDAGARTIKLSPTVLRTETAAIAVCAAAAGVP